MRECNGLGYGCDEDGNCYCRPIGCHTFVTGPELMADRLIYALVEIDYWLSILPTEEMETWPVWSLPDRAERWKVET